MYLLMYSIILVQNFSYLRILIFWCGRLPLHPHVDKYQITCGQAQSKSVLSFFYYNAKYLISKNIDFLVWAPSHASSQHHLSPKHKLFQFFFMIQLSVCPSINLSLLSWKFSYYLFEVLSAMIHSQSCFLSSLFKKINQNL